MASPTAHTPEPLNGNTSIEISVSPDSFGSPQEPISISLSSSPLTVHPAEESPLKSSNGACKSFPDLIESTNTPNRSGSNLLNQTPLRSTPLLTPPSSDERPLPQSYPVEVASPLFNIPTKQVPLTEKIMAQSALYSQAIHKKRQSSPTGPVYSEARNPINPTHQQQSVFGLTYHQLQQQQQHSLVSRQNPPIVVETKNGSTAHTSSNPGSHAESGPLTALELPNGAEIPRSCPKQRGEQEGSKQIATIPKPDPLENPLNTTNVYINGLPLRWTDDDLYRLTRGFGAVKSVKMFTRHLEDKPSAYGFVLFNCVEDAERFILALRQHTQFHPSFAKTMKVPGTTNAKHAIADPIIPVPRDEEYADIQIIGLPLTIDMQTLRALLAPQTIKANKFFHTAGTPRRLVGFIRLENQQAAEDIIERLHGSNVLGWSEKLNVQLLGAGSSKTSAIPEFQSDSFTVIRQDATSMKQPPFTTTAIAKPFFNPNIGIYQHNNVQVNDFARLLEGMKLPDASDQHDPSSTSFSLQSHKKQHLPVNVASSLNNPTPPNPPNLAYSQTQFPMGHISSQHFRPSLNTNGAGLGTAPALSLQDPHSAALATQIFTSKSDVMQRTLFQGMEDSPIELIQALQAAVVLQNADLSQLASSTKGNGTSVGDKKTSSEMTWSGKKDTIVGGHIQLGGGPGDFGAPSSGSDFSAPAIQSAGVKMPPVLTGNHPANFNPNSKTNKSVPFLLPALSPSSPQGSSEESSPVTPTFSQVPHSFSAGQTTADS